jgi:hypothetical protein
LTKLLCGGIVASTQKVVVAAYSRNVVLRGSELVGIFSKSCTLAGQEVIFRIALALNDISLA